MLKYRNDLVEEQERNHMMNKLLKEVTGFIR